MPRLSCLACLLVACSPLSPELEGLPCDQGRCLDGFVCQPATNTCVRQAPPCECTNFYRDDDGDGYGANDSACLCAPAAPFIAYIGGDCDDDPVDCGASCHPQNAAPDVCDGADQDCDGTIDEDPEQRWFRDADGDGYTSPGGTEQRCFDPDGAGVEWLAQPTAPDCDDGTAAGQCGAGCYPNNPTPDDCDGLDQDCDGVADDDFGSLWYHDADGDGFISSTDTYFSCTDPDGSGMAWRGTLSTADCNDADRASHPGAVEICDGNDNACSGTVPVAEADADGDRFVACSGWTDPQGDQPAILGGGDCATSVPARYPGAAELCDNLDNNCNPLVDEGLGAVCACSTASQKPLDVCGDGIDNDCNATIDGPQCVARWWVNGCAYDYRKPIAITAHGRTLMAQYAVKIVFDHAALVSAGKSLANGNDVRIVYASGATEFDEHRVLDRTSAWNTPTTTVWIRLRMAIPAATNSNNYFLYYGSASPSPPLQDETQVFDFADNFARADSASVGNGWSVGEQGNTDVRITGSALDFADMGDAARHRPYAMHALGGPSLDRVVWRFGYKWRRGSDTDYRIYMQLGSNLPDPATDDTTNNAGVAVNLLSASGTMADTVWEIDEDPTNPITEEGFGYFAGGLRRQLDRVSGEADVEVVADTISRTFSLRITQGASTRQYTGLAFANAVSSIDSVRFMVHRVGNWTADHHFTYINARRAMDDDCTVVVGIEQPNLC